MQIAHDLVRCAFTNGKAGVTALLQNVKHRFGRILAGNPDHIGSWHHDVVSDNLAKVQHVFDKALFGILGLRLRFFVDMLTQQLQLHAHVGFFHRQTYKLHQARHPAPKRIAHNVPDPQKRTQRC